MPLTFRKPNHIFQYVIVISFGFLCGILYSHLTRQSTGLSNVIHIPYSQNTGQTINAPNSTPKQSAIDAAKRVRILCMIVTMPRNYGKAISVKNTWAKRCNDYFFVSSEVNATLPSIAAVKNESRSVLWAKTMAGIKYAVENFEGRYDFLLKADDDTYVIMENLRKLLSDHDPNEPILMGRHFKPHVKQGYASGGAGYILSRSGLLKVNKGLVQGTLCNTKSQGSEDVHLSECAETNGVKLIESLDEKQRERFHPFPPGYIIDEAAMKATTWIWTYNSHPIKLGEECCSEHTISFHYISAEDMFEMEYLFYNLRSE